MHSSSQIIYLVSHPLQIMNCIRQGQRPQLLPATELPGMEQQPPPRLDDYVALMGKCWAQKPEDRPGMQEVAIALRAMTE